MEKVDSDLFDSYREIFLKIEKEKKVFKEKHGRDPEYYIAAKCPECESTGIVESVTLGENGHYNCSCSCGLRWKNEMV
jgi:hypothetical protein